MVRLQIQPAAHGPSDEFDVHDRATFPFLTRGESGPAELSAAEETNGIPAGALHLANQTLFAEIACQQWARVVSQLMLSTVEVARGTSGLWTRSIFSSTPCYGIHRAP